VYSSDDKQIDILRLGYRFLWVLLFLTFMVTMGYWHLPHTIYYVAGLLALLLPLIFSEKELFEIQNVHMCTLRDISEQRSAFYFT